jgi:hypothetical protein
MTESDNLALLGRKAFFLHPSALTQNQIVAELAQEEFEVYILKDEDKLKQTLSKFPDSIVFASINEFLKENAWEALLKSIVENPENSKVDLGVIASTGDEDLKKKYSSQFNLRCGYTVVKSDYSVAIKQLVILLNNVNAKGRRKFIRLGTEKEANVTVNLPVNGTFINGTIKDISVVGFSCVFAEEPGLKKNGVVGDIQIRLQSQLLKAEGIVFGSRMEGTEKIYVILFSQRVDSSVRTKIRKYIQTSLQNLLDQELK